MKKLVPHPCNACKAAIGTNHVAGCDVERCMLCGCQLISCNCVYTVNDIDPATLEEEHPDIYTDGASDAMWDRYDAKVEKLGGPELWTGLWPGTAECIEYGWYSKWVEGKGVMGARGGWVVCDGDDPDAGPDLNRLNSRECVWDRQERKWKRLGVRAERRPELKDLAADLTEVGCSVVAAWDLALDEDGVLSDTNTSAVREEIERLRKMVVEISPYIRLEPQRRFS